MPMIESQMVQPQAFTSLLPYCHGFDSGALGQETATQVKKNTMCNATMQLLQEATISLKNRMNNILKNCKQLSTCDTCVLPDDLSACVSLVDASTCRQGTMSVWVSVSTIVCAESQAAAVSCGCLWSVDSG